MLVGLAILLGTSARSFAQPAAVFPVRAGAWAQSLNGAWQFKYHAGLSAGADKNVFQSSFDATKWKSIRVPGHWELQGFAEPQYRWNDEGTELYRTTFRVPENWRGRRVFVPLTR